MKRLAFGSVLLSVAAIVGACSSEDNPPAVGTGGSPAVGGGSGTTGGSTSGGSATTTGGSTSGGSATTTGGSTSGGSATTTGGSTSGGSSAGGSGGAATGGSGGISTAGGGSGGVSTAGSGGAGGSTAGSGGSAGSTAGSGGKGGAGGAGGTGGAGGSAGGSGGAPPITIQELVGKLDGRLIVMPCGEQATTDDCLSAGATVYGAPTMDGVRLPCSNSQLNVVNDYRIGGTPGATYQVTMHFYGIMEPKNYGNNDRREAGTTRPQNANTGATPLPWYVGMPGQTYTASNYNTYEIRVLDNMMREVGTYFINSDTTDGHYTWVIDYEKTIPIIGGGIVRMRTFDANCRQIKNCTNGTSPCSAKARSVNISAAMPQPPANALSQPGLGQSAEHSGQWFLTDVVRFTGP